MALVLSTPLMLYGQQQPFVERVEVARVLVDARVLDEKGRSVRGLEPADFEVRIDGTLVRVESVEWIGGSAGTPGSPSSPSPSGLSDPVPRGRLIVFLVQKSLSATAAAVRIRDVGLMRVLQVTEPLLAQLTPDDRVAVLSFDSHLKIWTDFTNDVGRVRELLGTDVLLRRPGPLVASTDASLLPRLSRDRGRKAYTMEEALHVIGDALEPLPGAKAVVLLGYGFGRMNSISVLMPGYERARAALLAARAAVFSLDITQAHSHTLAESLQTASGDTGGFYASTNLFPHRAVERVAEALVGHYVLFVEKPDTRPGMHRIAVRLSRERGTVFARAVYFE